MSTNRQNGVLLVAIWLAFLARGLFYCVLQPMWEGYDEWAHFAYLQHLAEHHAIPDRGDLVSFEVRRSLRLVPLPQAAIVVGPGTITHDQFWRLDAEKSWPLKGDANIPAKQYEAQQPPLYYLMLVPLYKAISGLSLPARILALRIASVAIGSAVIFLGYAVGLLVLHSRKLAMLAAALLACLPELCLDVARVGNEGLAIVLASAIVLFSLRACRRRSAFLEWLMLGALLGAALLTKAYALALMPLPVVAALIRVIRHPKLLKQAAAWCSASWMAAIAIAGWWYWRTWVVTGTLSGEQLNVVTKNMPLAQKLSAIFHMNWRVVVDSMAFEHIWLGGWSFLVVRSWMYRVCELVVVLALLGLLMQVVRTRALARPAMILAAACVLMYLAVAYYSLLVFLVQNVSTAVGWYLYVVIVPEVVLLTLGFKRSPLAVAGVCIMAIALDLYTVHFLLMPYYTGLIGRRDAIGAGTLISQMGVVFQRLSLNKPDLVGSGTIVAVWAIYVCSTIALGGIAVFVGQRELRDATHQGSFTGRVAVRSPDE